MNAKLPEMLLEPLAAWAASITETRVPNEVITRVTPYIERWYLARKLMVPLEGGPQVESMVAGGGAPPPMIPSEIENIYLHRYVRSDAEPMHDHPWANASLILRGFIHEATAEGARMLMPGQLVARSAEQSHAIREVAPGTISLFVTLRKEREWGFLTEAGWESWRSFQPMFRGVA
jgi:hypothetical protein